MGSATGWPPIGRHRTPLVSRPLSFWDWVSFVASTTPHKLHLFRRAASQSERLYELISAGNWVHPVVYGCNSFIVPIGKSHVGLGIVGGGRRGRETMLRIAEPTRL